MITSLNIYLFIVYSNIIKEIIAGGILLCLSLIIGGIVFFIVYKELECNNFKELYDKYPAFFKWYKRFGVIMIICFELTLFMPKAEEILVIYFLPKIVNNEKIQEIPKKTLTIIDKYLEDLVEQTQKN